jgi:glycosyltransferase involved in cell wall biosynthesis
MRRDKEKIVNILGIRGIPAAHGGFETFAGRLAPYLREQGWRVNVYCQIEPEPNGRIRENYEDKWEGIDRIHIGTGRGGSAGSVAFDWSCIKDVVHRPGIDLVLGYNTAIFTIIQRLHGRKVFMNMDGIEWKRAKWSFPVKIWFYANEFIGANTASVPIADHPEIARHLRRHGCRRSVVIPYGADQIEEASTSHLSALNLDPGRYMISIARVEPENSIIELVRRFSARRNGLRLVVLGKLLNGQPYHDAVRAAAGPDVLFPGAIYEPAAVSALRYHAFAYLHGHQVGGTNPSLIEALGAGNAVIAHDNRFNRWVAGDDQFYFSNELELDLALAAVAEEGDRLQRARVAARKRHAAKFTWQRVLADYDDLLRSAL